MAGAAYFIRRHGDACSIVKLHPDGREEIFERGLTLVEAETLYFIYVGEPVHECRPPEASEPDRLKHRRPRQLAFKF